MYKCARVKANDIGTLDAVIDDWLAKNPDIEHVSLTVVVPHVVTQGWQSDYSAFITYKMRDPLRLHNER